MAIIPASALDGEKPTGADAGFLCPEIYVLGGFSEITRLAKRLNVIDCIHSAQCQRNDMIWLQRYFRLLLATAQTAIVVLGFQCPPFSSRMFPAPVLSRPPRLSRRLASFTVAIFVSVFSTVAVLAVPSLLFILCRSMLIVVVVLVLQTFGAVRRIPRLASGAMTFAAVVMQSIEVFAVTGKINRGLFNAADNTSFIEPKRMLYNVHRRNLLSGFGHAHGCYQQRVGLVLFSLYHGFGHCNA